MLGDTEVAVQNQQASARQQPRRIGKQQREARITQATRPVSVARSEAIEQQLLDFILAAPASLEAPGQISCQPGLAARRRAGDQQQLRTHAVQTVTPAAQTATLAVMSI